MSFPKYEKYKASGVEWLGNVPEGWELKRLKYIAALLTDKGEQHGRAIGLENIEGWTGRFVNSNADFKGEGVDFEKGDILFGKLRPYLAKVWLAEFAGEAVGDFHVMQPVQGICGRYVVYQILNRDFISIVDGSTYGARMPRVSWDFMANMRLPVPPLAEQTAIAGFLDAETGKIDGLVAEQRRLIALLKEKRQAVISHAVTQGLNPDVPMKDSGIEWLGDVPEAWAVGKCGYYVEILSGYAFPSSKFNDNESNIKLLRGINVGVGEIRWDDTVYWQRESDDDLDRFELSSGDLVIGMDRPWISTGVRVAKISNDDLPCLLLQRVASLTTNSGLHTDYLMYLLSSEMFTGYFEPETTGVSVPHISPSQIEDFVIPIPSIKEQNEIVDYISCETRMIDGLLIKAEQAIDLLQERRTALISAAVTGKIDVRQHSQEVGG